jgi:hypothetical protein
MRKRREKPDLDQSIGQIRACAVAWQNKFAGFFSPLYDAEVPSAHFTLNVKIMTHNLRHLYVFST